PVRNGVVVARQINIHFVDVSGRVLARTGRIGSNLDSALPVLKADGSRWITCRIATRHRSYCLVIQAGTYASIQSLHPEKLVCTRIGISNKAGGRRQKRPNRRDRKSVV